MKLLSRSEKAPVVVPEVEENLPPPSLPAPPRPAARSELNGLLGKGSSFEGKLNFEGTVHLDGNFTGEIRSQGTLIIGDSAKVQGDIDVGTVIINGVVSGRIRGRQLIEMHPPARVHAQILAPTLVIDRGVIFEGTSKMENLDAAEPEVLTPKPVQKAKPA